MTVAVVIPCYRQEGRLPRTVAAVERALEGRAWEGVIVRAGAADHALPGLGPRWKVLAPPLSRSLSPGAARMLGCTSTSAPRVLFCDADVEVEPAWLGVALARMERPDAPAGLGGRLEEWVEDAGISRLNVRDMYRVGDAEHEVGYLATLALYRRDALLRAGGYDPRLASEEDYELGMRLRRIGERMVSLGLPAGRHWSGPRPSLAELARRWSTGLCFGQGQVLRLYLGRPGLGELLGRQRLYLATLAAWLAGAAALLVLPRGAAPLGAWALAALLGLGLLWARKRSLRLALFSVATWSLNAAGMVRGFVAGPVAAHAPAPTETR